ncbi:MAG: cold shock domain-containing protein [Bacteroidota bacterium]
MADSFGKKEREKKRQKRKKEKAERKKRRKEEGVKSEEFMYLDEDGNLTSTPPDPTRKKKKIDPSTIEISIPKKEDVEFDPIRQGKVKFFNTEKGYGFIIDKETQESYYVHAESLESPIDAYDIVSFEISEGPKGLRAINVKLVK